MIAVWLIIEINKVECDCCGQEYKTQFISQYI